MMSNSIQDVHDPDSGPETWLFQNVLSRVGPPRPEDLPDQASRMKPSDERCERCAEPWKTIGRKVPEHTMLPVDVTRFWSPDIDWSKGVNFERMVTSAGAAANAFPPFRGRGLNNALEDAAKLFTEFIAVKEGRKSLKDGIEAYEMEMKERAIHEVDLFMKQAGVVHDCRR